jgi:hypothetical protein
MIVEYVVVTAILVKTVQEFLTEILLQTNVEYVITMPLTIVFRTSVVFGEEQEL